ncbi:MAG: hypothetical protein ACFNVU_09885, partial [Haemophilus seminalis]
SLFSCSGNLENRIVKNDEFINKKGIFFFKDYIIKIKQFDDGTLIYGIFDERNKPLFQQNLSESFSGSSKWTLYIDKKDKIWFYNSDYQVVSILYKEGGQVVYINKKDKLPTIPIELSSYLKQ